jgi:HAD superfamily hydrolase (TIGR01509 family)
VLGLPDPVAACLFDLDGVLTQTARVHAAAWKEMFDGYLRARAERTGEPFVPFRLPADYDDYVDGRPRADGTRTFLRSRGIALPEGSDTDTVADGTVRGLGNTKNAIVLREIAGGRVGVYPGSVRYVRAARDAGLARAVVPASTNCRDVLAAAGVEDLFDVVVDGIAAGRQRLRGKPAPDTYLAAARCVGASPATAAVFEDALAGVAAGRAGGFAWVVGIDRVGQRDALRREGADVVVTDLADLLPGS